MSEIVAANVFFSADRQTGIIGGTPNTFSIIAGNTTSLIANSSSVTLNNVSVTGNVTPSVSNTHDLGSTTLRWRNIYTNDLNLNNGIGDYTTVEGEDDLFLYNNKKGKVFKFALIEVDPSIAPKKMNN